MTTTHPPKKHPQTSKQAKTNIFWYGNIFSMIAVKIIGIIVIIWGIGMILREASSTKKEIHQEQALQIFSRIDDLAHIQMEDMQARGNPSNFTWFETFKQIDSQFHSAKTTQEKFERAKKMSIFFNGMDSYLHKVGWLTTPDDQSRDREYHAIKAIFDTLK